MDKIEILKELSQLVTEGQTVQGEFMLSQSYPFKPLKYEKRKYSKAKMLDIFIRDGFIDRYSGEKLIFPPVLRIFSSIYPKEFPYHRNWKLSDCHPAYWEMTPTIDHIIPIARGGSNDDDNLVCTSMIKNNAKSNFNLEELGWSLYSGGDMTQWDGLLSWFVSYVDQHPSILELKYIKLWHQVVKRKITY